MIVWVVVLGLVVPRLDNSGHPTHDIPLDVVNLLDAANLSSVHLGKKCVATEMQLEHVVTLLDGDRRWAFRWDEKMVTKTGFVAAILDHQGPESYLLTFSFAGETVSEATLVRIATTGDPVRRWRVGSLPIGVVPQALGRLGLQARHVRLRRATPWERRRIER